MTNTETEIILFYQQSHDRQTDRMLIEGLGFDLPVSSGQLTVWSHQQDELPRVALTAGLDEHNHLIVGVVRDVPPIY